MKKLITILTSIVAISMLSSCIIVAPEDEPQLIIQKKADKDDSANTQQQSSQTTQVVVTPSTAKYSITCKNGTSFTITDWCVKKNNIVTYANSGFNRSIRAGGEDMIMDLEEGYYKVYFSFADEYQLNPSDYYNTESILLNKDVIYTLYERQTSYVAECRSAGGSTTPQLYLAGSDGSEIDLISK